MRAVTYSRFSTDRQNESSIADQERVCVEYAQRQGWELAERYCDQGISGAALGNRPGVLRLQEAAFARRFDVLLVTDLSRLSRSQGDLSKMIDRLVVKGVRVVGVQDGYDSARRGHKLQAGLSGIIGEAFREMVKDRTYAALESRAKDKRPTGGRAYGYRDGKVHEPEARIVREIFGRYAEGASTRSIAAELNRRGVPSPGSMWKRSERRSIGWMGSGVRVILRNERYRGVVHWNASEWLKDPDTGKRLRIERPRSEWISHTDQGLRIVPEELWARVRRRIELTAEGGNWALPRGKPKYLLSGLLRCSSCGAHYVIANRHEYGCSSYIDGKACDNHVRVGRLSLEDDLIGPIRRDVLAPERIERMAKEMQAYYAQRVRETEQSACEAPRELAELTSRIERLRERLRQGDPDMPADELEAAIARAEGKRAELEAQRPEMQASARVLSILPKAAELFRRQVEQGLEGDPRASGKARVVLREWFCGRINLERQGEELWADYGVQRAALLKVVGNSGSGGRI